jgi:hypothetical protein
MENKIIPTATEFLKDLQHEYEETGEYKMYFAIDIPNKLKEFAKMHVEAALKAVLEKIRLSDEVCEVLQKHYFEEYINKESILNSYPLDNIKE